MYVFLDFIFKLMNLGIVGVILGGIIGYITSYTFTGRPRLSYQYLVVPYYLEDILGAEYLTSIRSPIKKSNLKRTYLVVWNSGNKLIDGSDISSKYRLGAQLYSVRGVAPIKSSKPYNSVTFSISDNQILFDFDYLKPGEGFVVQIISLSNHIKVQGDIKTSSKEVVNNRTIISLRGNKDFYAMSILCLIFTILNSLIYLYYGYIPTFGNFYIEPKFSSVLIYVPLLMAIFIYVYSKKHFPAHLKFYDQNLFYLEEENKIN